MSLIQAVTPYFRDLEQRLGARYRRRGGVSVSDVSEERVRATVLGDREYHVSLTKRGDNVLVDCDCRGGGKRSHCAHLWAALLEVQARGYLGVPPEDPGDDVPDSEDLEWFDEDYPPADGDVRALDRTFDEDDADPGPRHSEEPWKFRLRRIAALSFTPQAPWRAGREIHYFLSVPPQGMVRLDVVYRDPTKRGGWTRWRPRPVSPSFLDGVPEGVDRDILTILLGGDRDVYAYGFTRNEPASQFALTAALERLLVPRLCATGRLHLGDAHSHRDSTPPLVWDDGPPWRFRIDVVSSAEGLTVAGCLERNGGLTQELAVDTLLSPGDLLLLGGRVAPVETGGALAWIRELARGGALNLPRGGAGAFLQTLAKSARRPILILPAEVGVVEEPRPLRPRLRVKGASRASKGRLTADVTFQYGGDAVAGSGSPGWAVLVENGDGAPRLVPRDLKGETAALDALAAAGIRRETHLGITTHELSVRGLARAVSSLTQAGWLVEADGRLYRTAGPVRVSVASGIDWFDLKAEVDFDGQVVALPRILAALKRGEKTIVLGDGTLGMLAEEWLARYGAWTDLGSVTGDEVRFRAGQVAVLDALLAAQPEVAVDEAFARARAALARFDGVAPADAGPTFTGTLRGYQRDGLGWMRFLRDFGFGGCLADDMGLGKTVQVLALLDARRAEGASRPTLVVVPRSLIFNWRKEAERFTPGLRVLDHTGPERAKRAEGFRGQDVVLTTYGTLRRDAAWLKDAPFDYVILDEAQAIKNADTGSAKAARLLQADHRLALSGTPVENHLRELWSLFEFLNPGFLGRAAAMEAGSNDEARRFLARALRPYLLRRTKEQVARDLPAKVEQTLYCEMDKAQRELCDELKDHYRRSLLKRIAADGIQNSKMQVLEALLRLRQAACHPGLLDPKRAGEPSAKLDVLLPRLLEVLDEGHKALVFSQFTSFLAIVRQRLDAEKVPYAYLDGATRNREEVVRRFQEDPDCGSFLISLKAGGLGLNLTAAQYVFLLDPWWNPAVEAQAVDRTHRIGQTRQVFAYRLVVRGSIEEKVLALQESKRGLADAILGADRHLIRDLGREDLELLLS